MLEDALKQVLKAVAQDEFRRDLFLFERKTALEQFKLELADTANLLGLCPLVNSSMNRVTFDGNKSVVVLAIAYPEISFRFAGSVWTAIHGLETLDKYPDYAEAEKTRFQAQIRELS